MIQEELEKLGLVEFLGIEIPHHKKMEWLRRRKEMEDDYLMPGEYDITTCISFSRDRWKDAGDPIYRRCINEGCVARNHYDTEIYWIIRYEIMSIIVKVYDQYDLFLYDIVYDSNKVTHGLYCPFCRTLGQIVYEKEIMMTTGWMENDNGHEKFVEGLEVIVAEEPHEKIYIPEEEFYWRMTDSKIDIEKLHKYKFMPPLDCPFLRCSHYEEEKCMHLHCVIGEEIYNRLKCDAIIDTLLSP